MSTRERIAPNVFVLCTGRCGSTTFVKACKHFTNFSAGHETRSGLLGDDRFAYPENHIEADNRLVWFLGKLERHFGDRAAYVHLSRNPEEVAVSYAKRREFGIMRGYRERILMQATAARHVSYARDMVDTMEENIAFFLRDKTKTLSVRLETIKDDFARFIDFAGAEGDLDAALTTFDTRYNRSKKKRKKPAEATAPAS